MDTFYAVWFTSKNFAISVIDNINTVNGKIKIKYGKLLLEKYQRNI